jgi:hypothetical protein
MDNGYLEADELVECACTACGIPFFKLGMSDEDIARVCKWIGEHAPTNFVEDGRIVITTAGWDTMIFITIVEFPAFFEKHNLAMVWRN